MNRTNLAFLTLLLIGLPLTTLRAEIRLKPGQTVDPEITYQVTRKNSEPFVPNFTVQAVRDGSRRIVKAYVTFDIILSSSDSQDMLIPLREALGPNGSSWYGHMFREENGSTEDIESNQTPIGGLKMRMEIEGDRLVVSMSGRDLDFFTPQPIPYRFEGRNFGLTLGNILFTLPDTSSAHIELLMQVNGKQVTFTLPIKRITGTHVRP